MSSLFQAVRDCRLPSPGAECSGECAAVFLFPPEFPGFAGHFPGNPVLPGIAQIMAVLHACGPGAPPALRGIKTCKFLRPVRPGELVAVQGRRKGEGESASVAATLHIDNVLCASMTLFLAEPD
jgi:3-hydroxyacyl-[acyl-carrier-protein] dehydratase